MSKPMTNREKIRLAVELEDEDGQPITKLHPGETIEWSTSDETVTPLVEVDPPNPLERFATSGKDGVSTTTAKMVGFVNGKGEPVVVADVVFEEIEVTASALKAASGTTGEPEPEETPPTP